MTTVNDTIKVMQVNDKWVAVDTSEYAIIKGKRVNKLIAKADTLTEVLDLTGAWENNTYPAHLTIAKMREAFAKTRT